MAVCGGALQVAVVVRRARLRCVERHVGLAVDVQRRMVIEVYGGVVPHRVVMAFVAAEFVDHDVPVMAVRRRSGVRVLRHADRA